MASQPSSTAREASPSQFELTPRSKVKALLASLDNETDEENDSGSARARLVSAFTKSTAVPSNANCGSVQEAPRHPATPDSENDSEEEDIVLPKSRLAASMLDTDEDFDGDDEQHVGRGNFKPWNKSADSELNPDDSEENEAPVVARKRKVRVLHRSTPQSIPRDRTASPGLFVSPSANNSTPPNDNASESDELPAEPLENDRFKALVEKKRQERLAKEKEAAVEKARKLEQRKRQNEMLEEDEDISDDNMERRLTQQAKPSRKASKRAIEEMHRETQRLSRNMQLAHNAITKKKITKASLFAKFNYKPLGFAEEDIEESRQPTSSSSAAPSDREMHETPPTSPASRTSDVEKSTVIEGKPSAIVELGEAEDEEELPELQDALLQLVSSPSRLLSKGKERAIEIDESLPYPSKPLFKQRPVRIRPPTITERTATALDSSDSDLEIVSTTKRRNSRSNKLDSIFNRVPAKQAKESSSLHALRLLAHLASPGKQNHPKNKKASITTVGLQVSLQQRARQQATREREERLQALRDKGVIIQSAEERAKEIAEIEDLISKARREDQELQKREKAAAKKERKANGEVDLHGDSSDDEGWVEEKRDLAEELSVSEGEDEEGSENDDSETSGGDDQDELDIEVENAEPTEAASNPMFDYETDKTDEDDPEARAEYDLSMVEQIAHAGAVIGEAEEDAEEQLSTHKQRRNRKANIISDDEDEENAVQETPPARRTKSPGQQLADSSAAPNSVLRSATKTFIPGLTVAGPAGLGLTQIFAGTMDECQMEVSSTASHESQEYDSLAFLGRRPATELPAFVPTMEEDTQDVVVDSQNGINHDPESQAEDTQTEPIQLQFSQSQTHGHDSLAQDQPATQFSEMPEATQDAGFKHMTPIRGRFADVPPSTVETVVLDPSIEAESVEDSPIVKKKGKLRQRAPQVTSFSDDEDLAERDDMEVAVETQTDDLEITANVFDVMRKASKKKAIVVGEFDKKKSKAKEMVHEQADESEDEYAGLGGASDDESGGEEDEYVKAIIDDECEKDVDKSKLAAFFADRERANDEKQVEKLYNDITKGMLRRKRGADYDLSDSDDDGEARRRLKRKEFAKMRKALLADERIGKIAENPKRQAFLRAIEDRGSDDETGFLDDFVEQDANLDSQYQSQTEEQLVPDSQREAMGPPKRKRSADAAEAGNRLPPHLRRTKPNQKPSNLSEIRESLSSLIEEPNAMIAPIESASNSEDEHEIENEPKEKENRDPFALRRKNVETIDRIALKRASSSSSSTKTRLAFAASSSTLGFKVPPFLRRATTNNSLASNSSSASASISGVSAMERMAGGSGGEAIKRGGGKNSGVNYFARETERRAAVVKTEKKREQKRVKGAEGRREAVDSLFGGGKFE